MCLQSITSTESSFSAHKLGRYQRANGSVGLTGISDESSDDDDNDDDDLHVGQYAQCLFCVLLAYTCKYNKLYLLPMHISALLVADMHFSWSLI